MRDEKGRFVKGYKNYNHTEEWKKQSSERMKGEKNVAKRPEVREKIRQWHLGRKLSEETKRKMSESRKGRVSPNKGKKLSVECKKKISASLKGRNIGYKFQKGNQANKGRKQSKELRLRKSELFSGKNNPMYGAHRYGCEAPRWRGGKSFEPYGLDWTNTLKKSIRQRDNYTCQLCGKKQKRPRLDVHHIDYDKTNNDPINLVSLCHPCHSKTNNNRQLWRKVFNAELKVL